MSRLTALPPAARKARCPEEQRLLARLERHIDKAGGPNACWPWVGDMNRNGYGRVTFREGGRRTRRQAHRVYYELHYGPLPARLQLDHLCRNRVCANLSHLEPVTNRENSMRGSAPGILVHLSGKCNRGHLRSDSGARLPSGRWRCRACESERRNPSAATNSHGESVNREGGECL